MELCLTLFHTWQQGVWCFRSCLQPGSRLLLRTVRSHLFCSCSLACKSHPACHFAQSLRLSVHHNLLPRLHRSAIRNLQLTPHPCCPTTCHQTTTLWTLPITGTESGATYLGAFALSFKSQVLNHVSQCSWTRWTAMFSCVCWTTGCTSDGR